jgi:hypothetical protein
MNAVNRNKEREGADYVRGAKRGANTKDNKKERKVCARKKKKKD